MLVPYDYIAPLTFRLELCNPGEGRDLSLPSAQRGQRGLLPSPVSKE